METISLLPAAARRLNGKVALITGAAAGIGECAARIFAKHGAKLILADIQDDLGFSLSKHLNNSTPSSYLHCDVSDENDVKNAVDFAISEHGKLDIMFNNAGIPGSHTLNIWEYEKAQFEKVLSTNLVGAFLGTKHAARVMIPARQGSIISTASVCSALGGLTCCSYTSSKHGLVGLTQNSAVELGPYGVRVNCISPHVVNTSLSKVAMNVDDDKEFDKHDFNLKGKLCAREDVAEAAIYLGSDESKYISGHNLLIDGGFSITNVGFHRFG